MWFTGQVLTGDLEFAISPQRLNNVKDLIVGHQNDFLLLKSLFHWRRIKKMCF